MTLMDALRRMTLEPARRLERRVPAMANKGRIRVKADADLAIFNPATVIDRATYENATLPSAGIPYVVVGGQVVVDRGELTAARPGRALRAPSALLLRDERRGDSGRLKPASTRAGLYSSSSAPGSSTSSFTRTRKRTASEPSTIR